MGSTCDPSHLRGWQKEKKRALQPSTICCCFHSPGNTPTLQLPLPNALGSAQTLGHCLFPKPTTRKGWCSTSFMAKWDRVLLEWSAGGRGKPPQLSLIPEVGAAHCHWGYLNKNHLQPQPSQRALQRTLLQTTCCSSHPLGRTPALLMPLSNALGSAQMLDHYHFPGTCN